MFWAKPMLTDWSQWESAQWELESGNSFPLLHSYFSGFAISWAVVSDAEKLAEDVKKGIIYSLSLATEDITSSTTDTFFLQRKRSEIWHPNEWPVVEVHARCSWGEPISRYVSVLSEGRWLMRPKSWPLGPSWVQPASAEISGPTSPAFFFETIKNGLTQKMKGILLLLLF